MADRTSSLAHLVGMGFLRAFGWRLETVSADPKKFVLIAAPHTSGWDLPFMLSTSYSMQVPISWMGKHELFAPPWGWFMRALGGIPIDRASRNNVVGWAIEQFEKHDRLVLAVPAEGTRKKVEYWKSGFYHIALGAKVPIGLGYLDFAKKACGIRGFVTPTGDVRADMDKVRELYRGVTAKFPEHYGEPRLREEDQEKEAGVRQAP